MDTLMIAAENALPIVYRLGYRAAFERMALDRGLRFGHELAEIEPHEARIEHGRWISDCPNCQGAENVTEDDAVMYCCSCGNEHLDGNLAPVKFPEESDRKAIERLLLGRPRTNQNWRPGETLALLASENVEHGIVSVVER